MDKEVVQYTDSEDDRNTDLHLPAHLQAPEDPLGKEEHDNVRDDLDTGRGEVPSVDIVTRSIDQAVASICCAPVSSLYAVSLVKSNSIRDEHMRGSPWLA